MYVHKGTALHEARPAGHIPHALLHTDETVRLTAVSRHREKDLIYAQGDAAGDLYLVEFGCVRVSRITPEGRRLVASFNFAGDVFGFEPGTERQCYAEALESSGTRRFRLGARELADPAISELMFNHLERVQQHLMILGTQNAIERVAAFLVGLYERQGAPAGVRLPMSRCDIAEHLGLTLETVSRAMHRLELLGLVKLAGARLVKLLDREAMLALGA